jgi:hypothetical protein
MSDDQQLQPTEATAATEVTLRRAPKYPVFLVLGALAGALGTLVLTASFPVDPAVGFAALYGYFVLFGIPIGVVLGALVAIILDRVSVRRAKRMAAELTTVDRLPYDDELED